MRGNFALEEMLDHEDSELRPGILNVRKTQKHVNIHVGTFLTALTTDCSTDIIERIHFILSVLTRVFGTGLAATAGRFAFAF